MFGDQFQRRVQYPGLSGGARDRAEPAVLLSGRHSDEGSPGLTAWLPIGYRPSCRSATNATCEEGSTMRRTDGELILFWTLPALAIIWVSAFFLFPGFLHPMSPTMSADEVAGFYRDETARIRYSMILFNWFGVGLIPTVILLAMQVRRMAHRTPILSYCLISCAAGPPCLFLIANMFWLLGAFRPERAPELTQLLNDLAWVTFTVLVPWFIAQCLLLALGIYWDRHDQPVFNP